MEPQALQAKTVRGISVRTTHATASDDIGALWARAEAVGALVGETALAVYSDYELLPDGYEVTVTVGSPSPGDGVAAPEGFVEVHVPAQTCAVFETDGSIEQVVEAWQDVWRRWPDGGPRSFSADLEIWHQGPDGRPRAADVCVGVRG